MRMDDLTTRPFVAVLMDDSVEIIMATNAEVFHMGRKAAVDELAGKNRKYSIVIGPFETLRGARYYIDHHTATLSVPEAEALAYEEFVKIKKELRYNDTRPID